MTQTGLQDIIDSANAIEDQAAETHRLLNPDTYKAIPNSVWLMYPKPNVTQLKNQLTQFGESESTAALVLSLIMGALLTFFGLRYVQTNNQVSKQAEDHTDSTTVSQ